MSNSSHDGLLEYETDDHPNCQCAHFVISIRTAPRAEQAIRFGMSLAEWSDRMADLREDTAVGLPWREFTRRLTELLSEHQLYDPHAVYPGHDEHSVRFAQKTPPAYKRGSIARSAITDILEEPDEARGGEAMTKSVTDVA